MRRERPPSREDIGTKKFGRRRPRGPSGESKKSKWIAGTVEDRPRLVAYRPFGRVTLSSPETGWLVPHRKRIGGWRMVPKSMGGLRNDLRRSTRDPGQGRTELRGSGDWRSPSPSPIGEVGETARLTNESPWERTKHYEWEDGKQPSTLACPPCVYVGATLLGDGKRK